MRSLGHALGVAVGAVACAVVFGVGIPLFWVWLASQIQPSDAGGQGVGMAAAAMVILGPLASYIVLVVFAGRLRFTQPADARREPQRMAWSRGRDEIREKAKTTTTFEQIVLLAILIVGFGFEVWYLGFAHCSTAVCFG